MHVLLHVGFLVLFNSMCKNARVYNKKLIKIQSQSSPKIKSIYLEKNTNWNVLSVCVKSKCYKIFCKLQSETYSYNVSWLPSCSGLIMKALPHPTNDFNVITI